MLKIKSIESRWYSCRNIKINRREESEVANKSTHQDLRYGRYTHGVAEMSVLTFLKIGMLGNAASFGP